MKLLSEEITPDGLRYLELADTAQHAPYHYRWLVPFLAKGDAKKMRAITIGSLVALLILSRLYTKTWKGTALVAALPGVVKFNLDYPVLVDAPAQVLALAAALSVERQWWVTAVVCSLAGGATKESAPLFAALYASHPLPLVGLVCPLLRHKGVVPLGDEPEWEPFDRWVLRHPFQAAKLVRRGNAKDWKLWLSPWGAALVGLVNPTPQVIVTTALAYAQCAVATDSVRLYQWAWPVLVRNATRNLGGWWLVAVVAHYWNPFKGSGA